MTKTIQEATEETSIERELNILFEMTLRMEHELLVAMAESEE